MDAAESSIKTWLKFFMAADIPAGVATEYAISFSDNRMRLDMLSELTKDYLRDLNITVLGDVIAILKHAKAVSQKEYQARKMSAGGGLSPSPSPPPPPSERKVSAPAVKAASSAESPASRMVKRLVRKDPPPPPSPQTRAKRTAEIDDGDSGDGPSSAKRRMVASGRLGVANGAASAKKTVFDRLGSDSQVSSTTPDSTTRFRITGLSGSSPTERAPLHDDEPAAAAAAPRQRVTFVGAAPARGPALPYAGVLKPGSAAERAAEAAAAARPTRVTGTLASDRERAAVSARSRVGVSTPSRAGSAASRAGLAASRAGAAASRAGVAASPAGVRSRLAPQGSAGARGRPAGAGVKARLGASGGGGGGASGVRSRLGSAAR